MERNYLWCSDHKSWIHPIRMAWDTTCGKCKTSNPLSTTDDEGKTFEESTANKEIKAPITQNNLAFYKNAITRFMNKYSKNKEVSAYSLHTNLVININEVEEVAKAFPDFFAFNPNGDDGRGTIKIVM